MGLAAAVLLCAILLLVGALYLLPEAVHHWLHRGVIWRGSPYKRHLCLTFDDGPDPVYTKRVASLLLERGIPAVFFVTGRQMRRHPELVTWLNQNGFTVGYHGDRHIHPWLMGGIKANAEWKAGLHELNQLLGTNPAQTPFRPPWGMFNRWTKRLADRDKVPVMLWSINSFDWTTKGAYAIRCQRTLRHTVNRLHNGAIILMHDRRPHGEKPVSLEILAQLIDEAEKRQFRFVGYETIRSEHLEMTETAAKLSPLLRSWQIWERLFARKYRIRSINQIFRAQVTPYHGPVLHTPNGALIKPGTPGLELHFQNLSFNMFHRSGSSAVSDTKAVMRALKEVRVALPDLAQVVAAHPDYAQVKVIFGISMLNRGPEQLGFHVDALPPTLANRWFNLWMRLQLIIYHPSGRRRLHERRELLQPKMVWITRDELLERYLPTAAPGKEK